MSFTMQGIDCAMEVSAAAAKQIKAAGYSFVCRYLVPSSMAWKDLTKPEAHNISAAGLQLLCVYETTADRVKGGAKAGEQDGRTALALARSIEMPKTGYIYYAVDYEPTAADLDTIEAYLRAAAAACAPYAIGVYGNYNVIEAMKARNACVGFWQCYAWSYKKKSAHRNVYQYQNARTVAGISVDLDEAYSTAGFWNYEEDDDMSAIIEKVKQATGKTDDEIAQALTALVQLGNPTEEPWEVAGAKYLVDAKLAQVQHKGNEGVEYGELGVILQNLEKKFSTQK